MRTPFATVSPVTGPDGQVWGVLLADCVCAARFEDREEALDLRDRINAAHDAYALGIPIYKVPQELRGRHE